MIAALFAVDEKGGMGNNGDMPWPMIKEDMRWFKTATEGHVVVMGKRSWLSPDMPKPLPNRHNVVVTNNFIDQPDIDQIRGDVCEGLKRIEKKYPDSKIFVIGGADLLMQAKPVLDRAYITRVPGTYDCDTAIKMDSFLSDLKLVNTFDLGPCKVEEYATI